MGSVVVVFVDGLFELIAQGSKVGQQVAPIIEFFLEGPVAPFDAAIVGGFAGRQDLKGDIHVLAGSLELGHELRAPVNLD